MVKDQEKIAALLRALATCIEKSSASELESLIGGRGRLSVTRKGNESPSLSESKDISSSLLESDLGELSTRLLSLGSREEGVELIEAAQLTRRSLEKLARGFGLPVRKEDNIERLRDRIIDATIGTRLNSRAIRGS